MKLAFIAGLAALLVSAPLLGRQAPAVQPKTKPGIAIGSKPADAELLTIDNKPVKLSSLYEKGPVVIAFYRGGWCPYCSNELTEWQGKLEALKAAGGTLIAISPEKPEKAAGTVKREHIEFMVLSDTTQEAAKAFKVHFAMDEAMRDQYREFGLDLKEWNASETWELPAPGTFVVDTAGKVRYAFADWDYKKRANPNEVIKAVKAAAPRQSPTKKKK